MGATQEYGISIRGSSLGLMLCVGVGLSPCGVVAEAGPAAAETEFTYVIVHGAWGGGWAFREVDRLLTARGHAVYRPTLTGQGERVHLARPDIDLSTHIEDVVNTILFEELDDIVLVGHSYGGMVVTGVMDRMPERIRHVIFLDAMAPNDGESAHGVMGRAGPGGEEGGFLVPAWVRADQPPPKDVPHPAKTLSEPVSYRNPAALALPVTYILTVDPGRAPEEDGFHGSYLRAQERGWRTQTMEADHNPQWSRPGALVELLHESPRAADHDGPIHRADPPRA